jgi:hypothetical protein
MSEEKPKESADNNNQKYITIIKDLKIKLDVLKNGYIKEKEKTKSLEDKIRQMEEELKSKGEKKKESSKNSSKKEEIKKKKKKKEE